MSQLIFTSYPYHCNVMEYPDKLTAPNIVLFSCKPRQKRVLTRIQSVIQSEWAKNLSTLEQQSFFGSARPCRTVYMLGLWLAKSIFHHTPCVLDCGPNILFCKRRNVGFVWLTWYCECIPLTSVLCWCYSLLLLTCNAFGTSVWTSVKTREEN